MIKIIKLDYMINGYNGYGEPCKDIETQVQDIFVKHPEYKYLDLIYKEKNNVKNMRYATLIVEVVQEKNSK